MSAKLIRKKHSVRKRAAKSQLLISIFCDLSEHFCFPVFPLFVIFAAFSSTTATTKEGCVTPRTPVSVERKALFSECLPISCQTNTEMMLLHTHLPDLDFVLSPAASSELITWFSSCPLKFICSHMCSLSNNLYNWFITMLVWYNYCY